MGHFMYVCTWEKLYVWRYKCVRVPVYVCETAFMSLSACTEVSICVYKQRYSHIYVCRYM